MEDWRYVACYEGQILGEGPTAYEALLEAIKTEPKPVHVECIAYDASRHKIEIDGGILKLKEK